jgi:hypothetical protein
MKKPVILAALFMSCFAFGLAVMAIMLIYTGTAEEVQSVRDQQLEMDRMIDKARQNQLQNPSDRKLNIKLKKLNMERVLLPQPWVLEMEMVDKGPINFLLHVLGSAEARKEKLRNLVLERAALTDLDGCPEEFRRLFRIYASPTGFGMESLQNLRNFAENYSGNDDFGLPEETPSQ